MNVVIECGIIAWPILLMIAVAVPFSVVALALSLGRKRSAVVLAGLALSAALVPFTLGVLGENLGRARVDDLLEGGQLAPDHVELVREMGYAEAAQCKKLGLGGTVPPSLVALIALGLTMLRKAPSAGAAPPP